MSQNSRVRFYRECGGITVEHWQDCEPVLERNKLLRDQPQKSDWGRHVASIPNGVLLKWLHEEWNRGNFIKAFGPEMDELVDRKLRDPEWKHLRVDK